MSVGFYVGEDAIDPSGMSANVGGMASSSTGNGTMTFRTGAQALASPLVAVGTTLNLIGSF